MTPPRLITYLKTRLMERVQLATCILVVTRSVGIDRNGQRWVVVESYDGVEMTTHEWRKIA
jgi:hypothetical protein